MGMAAVAEKETNIDPVKIELWWINLQNFDKQCFIGGPSRYSVSHTVQCVFARAVGACKIQV